MLPVILTIIAMFLLCVQISSVVYAVIKNIKPSEVLYGFGIWGCIPIIILCGLSQLLL